MYRANKCLLSFLFRRWHNFIQLRSIFGHSQLNVVSKWRYNIRRYLQFRQTITKSVGMENMFIVISKNKSQTFAYFSTYLWDSACFAVSLLVGSMTSSDLTKSLASTAVSISNSSMFGFEHIDFDDWFNKDEPKPFPTDFKSLSLGCGNADKMHSIYRKMVFFSFSFQLICSVMVKLFFAIYTWLIVQLPGNSGLPRHISPNIQPRLHMSMPFVYFLLAINISGARYHRVAMYMYICEKWPKRKMKNKLFEVCHH